VFYKVGGRPWKVASIRASVCYVGLVFKKDETEGKLRNACCAAQMFLDSGDGVVFKGAVGPWYNEDTGDNHLSRSAAKEPAGSGKTMLVKRLARILSRLTFEEAIETDKIHSIDRNS